MNNTMEITYENIHEVLIYNEFKWHGIFGYTKENLSQSVLKIVDISVCRNHREIEEKYLILNRDLQSDQVESLVRCYTDASFLYHMELYGCKLKPLPATSESEVTHDNIY